jgi:hypothetical protein
MTTMMNLLNEGNVCFFDIMRQCKHSNCNKEHIKSKYKDKLQKFIKNPSILFNPKQTKSKIMKAIGTTSPIFISTCSACLRGFPCRNERDGRVKHISIKFNNKTIEIDCCYGDIEQKKKNLFVGLHIQFKFNENPFKVVEITPYVAPVILTHEEIIEIEKKKIEDQIKKALDGSNFPSLAPKNKIKCKKVDDVDDVNEWSEIPHKTKSKKTTTIKFTITKTPSHEVPKGVSWSNIIKKEYIEKILPAPTLIINTDTSKVQELKMENPVILSTKKYSKQASLINNSKQVDYTSDDDFEEYDFEEEYEEQEELSWDDDPQWE